MNGFYEALLMATGIMYLYALISCQLLFFCRKSIKRNKTKLKLIIYNFKLRAKDSIVKSIEELEKFKESRIKACIDAGNALLKEGFELGPEEEIELAQKPHFVIFTENGYSHKDIGDLVIAYIKDGIRTLMHDHSPTNPFGKPETETDNEKDAKDLLEAPKRVEKVENIMTQINLTLNKIVQDQSVNSQVISNLNKTQEHIATNLALVAQVVHNLANQNERILS